MTLVSHRYKFIFIKTRKVAGSSLESFLRQYCCDPNTPVKIIHNTNKQQVNKFGVIAHNTHNNSSSSIRSGTGGIWRQHLSGEKIKKYIGDDIFNKYYKFCVVRNPWDRIVSLYYWRNKAKIPFKKYVKGLRTTWDWGNNWEKYVINDKPICDYYIRYENLYDDIAKVCDHLGIKDCNLDNIPTYKGNKRKNKKRPYQEYYDDKTKKLVEKYHKKEINYFGYEF